MFLKFPKIKSLPRGLKNSERFPGKMAQVSKTLGNQWFYYPETCSWTTGSAAQIWMPLWIFLFSYPANPIHPSMALFYPIFSYHTLLDTLPTAPAPALCSHCARWRWFVRVMSVLQDDGVAVTCARWRWCVWVMSVLQDDASMKIVQCWLQSRSFFPKLQINSVKQLVCFRASHVRAESLVTKSSSMGRSPRVSRVESLGGGGAEKPCLLSWPS